MKRITFLCCFLHSAFCFCVEAAYGPQVTKSETQPNVPLTWNNTMAASDFLLLDGTSIGSSFTNVWAQATFYPENTTNSYLTAVPFAPLPGRAFNHRDLVFNSFYSDMQLTYNQGYILTNEMARYLTNGIVAAWNQTEPYGNGIRFYFAEPDRKSTRLN